jgi:integrase
MIRVTGSLITVQRHDGPVYFLKARDRDGRQIKKRLGPVADWPQKLAQDALRDFLTDLGRVPDRGDESVTFRYAAGAWLRYVEHDRNRAASTVRDYRNTVERHLTRRFGDRPLSEITVDDVERLRGDLLDTLSPRTTQKTMVLLHGVFRFANRRGWMTTNPASEAERVTVKRRPEFAVLSPTEVQAVARKTTTEQDAALILVAAFTGLRLGELRALRWRDVDFGNQIVHVRRSHYGKASAKEGPPKSGQARSVPLIDLAARALDGLSRRKRFSEPSDRVFCDPAGETLNDGAIRTALYDALEGAGIDRDRGTGKLFVFHDLRHTFGTLAVQAFPLSDVQAYMGHADIGTTMVYVHHTPQRAAADRLGQLVASTASLLTNDPLATAFNTGEEANRIVRTDAPGLHSED